MYAQNGTPYGDHSGGELWVLDYPMIILINKPEKRNALLSMLLLTRGMRRFAMQMTRDCKQSSTEWSLSDVRGSPAPPKEPCWLHEKEFLVSLHVMYIFV